MITLDTLAQPGVAHGFFTREGGVSTGIYASLNCGIGSGDEPDAVAENRARVARVLGIARDAVVTNNQVHGIAVVTVEDAAPARERPRADALVTRRRGVALGILTADCVPVLFADADAGIIGAAHAGWRGAVGGVLDATVRAMVALGARPARIHAGIGPAIAQASYEVGAEFPAPFLAQDRANDRFFVAAANGKFRFDLPGYVRAQLDRLGLGAIAATGADTAAEPARFFSYRRSRLQGEPDYGRLLSAIALL
ncbi:MAG TPA: peptidoglycan editing factor PgeF [Stellaceae bacterium]|jgi:hypothetical protein|nr:peptidoglycan editing factor PgeF [Stellaceae bacterium]